MHPFESVPGTHRLVTLQVPGRPPARLLCLVQRDGGGEEAYYVLAECEGSAIKWRSMIRDSAVRRLKNEFVHSITTEQDVDALEVETIFFCAAEASAT